MAEGASSSAGDEAHKLLEIVRDDPPAIPSRSNNGATRTPLLKPFAIRDCPPEMRIRGGRPLREKNKQKVDEEAERIRIGGPRPREEKNKQKVDDEGERIRIRGGRPREEKNKQKVDEVVEMYKKFDPTVDELKPEVPARSRVIYIIEQFDKQLDFFIAAKAHRVKTAGPKIKAKGSGSVWVKNAGLKAKVKGSGSGSGSARVKKARQKTKAKGSDWDRPDRKAFTAMVGYRVNGTDRIRGDVPGVEVGDCFTYRAELFIISLHKDLQGGIDYFRERSSPVRDNNGKKVSAAVSVVISGGYLDNKDKSLGSGRSSSGDAGQDGNHYVGDGHTFQYAGQGGSHYVGDPGKESDQKLEKGNLALKNCCDLGHSVRVIRRYRHNPSSELMYRYDGLYLVADFKAEVGVSGTKKVFKYTLIRVPGQRTLPLPLSASEGVPGIFLRAMGGNVDPHPQRLP